MTYCVFCFSYDASFIVGISTQYIPILRYPRYGTETFMLIELYFFQEVWYVVLESLHHMLLPMLQWDKEGVQATNSDFPPHHYTSRQCTALETMLEILRVCYI